MTELRTLFALALGSFQPGHAARPHDMRDLSAKIELADAVGIVLGASFVERGRSGTSQAAAEQQQRRQQRSHQASLRLK